jgi:Domain of unknown function (DUF4920)
MRYVVSLPAIASVLAGLAGLALGCGRSDAPSPVATASSAAPIPSGTLLLGERISTPIVSLADIAAHPAQFQNHVIATTGKVTSVCQERGCWMEIADASGQAHVRMHGHSFFVPKTSSGHVARVQATVLSAPGETCADSPPPGKTVAQIELDATGIELD